MKRLPQRRLLELAFDATLAEERERRRLAVVLHERIGQSMALAHIKLSTVRDSVSGATREAVDDALLLLSQSLELTRALTFDLSPPILYDLGLKEALSWLADDFEARCDLRIELDLDPEPTPLEDTSAALVFHAVRTLLLNVARHAESRTAGLSLKRVEDRIQIRVEDRGVGFDAVSPELWQMGFGLFTVRERIERLGGSVEVMSAPAQGTRITLEVPVRSNGEGQSTERGARDLLE